MWKCGAVSQALFSRIEVTSLKDDDPLIKEWFLCPSSQRKQTLRCCLALSEVLKAAWVTQSCSTNPGWEDSCKIWQIQTQVSAERRDRGAQGLTMDEEHTKKRTQRGGRAIMKVRGKQQDEEERSWRRAEQQVVEGRRGAEQSAAKQQALKEKRCEIETNKSRTGSYSRGSHNGCNTCPHSCSLFNLSLAFCCQGAFQHVGHSCSMTQGTAPEHTRNKHPEVKAWVFLHWLKKKPNKQKKHKTSSTTVLYCEFGFTSAALTVFSERGSLDAVFCCECTCKDGVHVLKDVLHCTL